MIAASPAPMPMRQVFPGFIGTPLTAHNLRTFLSIIRHGPVLGSPTPGLFITGPAGTGKATLLQSAVTEWGVPVVELDPLDYLPALGGAVPRRMEDAVTEFCSQVTEVSPDRWLGIILLRNIDRLARAGEVGTLLQANLASLVKRRSLSVPHHGRMIPVNPATQITFALTSSLPDLQPGRLMGFGSDPGASCKPGPDIGTGDTELRNYGFSASLLDAFKLRLHLPPLDVDALREILRLPGNGAMIKRFAKDCLDIALEFSPCAEAAIARRAVDFGRNGHSLETIHYEILRNISEHRQTVFPDRAVRIVVRRETVESGAAPEMKATGHLKPGILQGNVPAESAANAGQPFLRRPGRGSGSPADVRLATRSDLNRWLS